MKQVLIRDTVILCSIRRGVCDTYNYMHIIIWPSASIYTHTYVPRLEKALLESGLLVVPKLDLTVEGGQLDSLLSGHWVSAFYHGLVALGERAREAWIVRRLMVASFPGFIALGGVSLGSFQMTLHWTESTATPTHLSLKVLLTIAASKNRETTVR